MGKTIADYPQLVEQWDWKRNGDLRPENVPHGSAKKIWWKCNAGPDHKWISKVCNRTREKRRCPFCVNNRVSITNCLANVRPDIAAQWHETKNVDKTPYDFTAGSHKKVWWQCPIEQDHEWEAAIHTRTGNGLGCPCCSGKKIVKSNCLATLFPEVAAEWHETKNGLLTPYMVAPNTDKYAWWRCKNFPQHEWRAPIGNRTATTGCPKCRKSKGEIAVSKELRKRNIRNKEQWRFSGCRNKLKLPFDFVIYYQKQAAAIEFQGEQHFIPLGFRSRKNNASSLEQVQLRDAIKRKFCKEKGIPLLEIPYWKMAEIGSLLDEFLSQITAA